jgi:hypothetical protein
MLSLPREMHPFFLSPASIWVQFSYQNSRSLFQKIRRAQPAAFVTSSGTVIAHNRLQHV